MLNCLPLLIIIFLFGVIPTPALAAQKPVKFLFCYENKEVLPHFIGGGRDVPQESPGATIDIMRALDEQVSEIYIDFVRYPWKRCLGDLQDGHVDGVIGRFSEDRASFGVFPREPSGELDQNKAMLTNQTCLIHSRKTDLKWDGKSLVFGRPVTVSAPSGYQLIKDLKTKGFQIYEANTIDIAHRLLFNHRVDASVATCTEQNLPIGIKLNPIPIVSNSGFLIFSQSFYKDNTSAAKALWGALEKLDKARFYKKYADAK